MSSSIVQALTEHHPSWLGYKPLILSALLREVNWQDLYVGAQRLAQRFPADRTSAAGRVDAGSCAIHVTWRNRGKDCNENKNPSN